MNCLGSVLQDLGRLDEAEQHYRRPRRMLESQFGPDDPDLVFALNNLGGLMMVRGPLSEALGSGNSPLRCVNAAIRRRIQ
jgi:Flp pilus assembly protein TadD